MTSKVVIVDDVMRCCNATNVHLSVHENIIAARNLSEYFCVRSLKRPPHENLSGVTENDELHFAVHRVPPRKLSLHGISEVFSIYYAEIII